MGHPRQIHCAPSRYAPDFSRLFPVCVWILPFAIFPVPVVLLPLSLFHPLFCLPLIRITIPERPWVKIFPPPMFQQRWNPEVSRLENTAGNPVRAAVLTLG